ncbi:MAG: hypothetical protein L0214_07585 [candidate division NC10 bacterium]|nr:hypothetical protein [candidate division NC10 bacterium]
MTTRSKFLKERVVQAKLGVLTAAWAEVAVLLHNNRPHDALTLVDEVMPGVDEAGDRLTATQYPPCLACTPPGSAEVLHPTEPQRKLVCYLDSGDVAGKLHCPGNNYGRMHPVQLREYIMALIAAREPRAVPEGLHQHEHVIDTEGRSVHVEPTPTPTPPPET